MGNSEWNAEEAWHQNTYLGGQGEYGYPGEESEDYHHNVKIRNGEEVAAAVRENVRFGRAMHDWLWFAPCSGMKTTM